MAQRWFIRHRQKWIAETLRVFRFIRRAHLERKFGISTPQASLDLKRYQEDHPRAMKYDSSLKCYLAVNKEGRPAPQAAGDAVETIDER